jgi:hypothetical protein
MARSSGLINDITNLPWRIVDEHVVDASNLAVERCDRIPDKAEQASQVRIVFVTVPSGLRRRCGDKESERRRVGDSAI